MNKCIEVLFDDGSRFKVQADKYEWEDNLVNIYKDNKLIATFFIDYIKGVYELNEQK